LNEFGHVLGKRNPEYTPNADKKDNFKYRAQDPLEIFDHLLTYLDEAMEQEHTKEVEDVPQCSAKLTKEELF
jgi:hypothetical protein